MICLYRGEYDLPENVEVFTLGKEIGTSKLTRIRRFLAYVREYKDDYDTVFVHMNPEYVVLAGLLWRKWGKRILLWYTHKNVHLTLRLATKLADMIFTASPESFRLPTPKVRVVGHGIDTDFFKPEMREFSIETRIVTSGRVTPSKHIIEMLRVLDELYKKGEKFRFTIVGTTATEQDEQYAETLEAEIQKRPYHEKVHLVGAVPQGEMPELLNEQDVFLNFSTTGSLDKAVLEALATGVPVVTTNEAFKDLLAPFGLYVPVKNYHTLAEAVSGVMNRPDRAAVVATLRGKIAEEHSLARLIPKIIRLAQ